MAKKIIHSSKDASQELQDADESKSESSEEPQVSQVLALIRHQIFGVIDGIEKASSLIASQFHEHVHSK